MPSKKNDNRIAQLAVAVASGRSVAAWARDANVAVRTAYAWTATAGFQAMVADHRRKLVDRAIGKLAAHVTLGVTTIARLAKNAESESVKLAAARAILAELVAITGFAELEGRIAALEKRVQAPPGDPTP